MLRIFFDRKSISDKEIDELLMAKTLKRISGHVHLREISGREDYPDEMYYDYGDYALQDPGTSVMEGKPPRCLIIHNVYRILSAEMVTFRYSFCLTMSQTSFLPHRHGYQCSLH